MGRRLQERRQRCSSVQRATPTTTRLLAQYAHPSPASARHLRPSASSSSSSKERTCEHEEGSQQSHAMELPLDRLLLDLLRALARAGATRLGGEEDEQRDGIERLRARAEDWSESCRVSPRERASEVTRKHRVSTSHARAREKGQAGSCSRTATTRSHQHGLRHNEERLEVAAVHVERDNVLPAGRHPPARPFLTGAGHPSTASSFA